MRRVVALAACLAVACAAMGQLDGRTITLKAAETPIAAAPVTIAFQGSAPEQKVRVVNTATEAVYPATVRDGELTFIVDNAGLNAGGTLKVEAVSDDAAARVQVTDNPAESRVDVVIDGKPLTSYYYSNDNRRPYLWPLLSENGVTVTRDYPMGPAKGSEDHPHHVSFWSAHGAVNDADVWQGENGWQHVDNVEVGSGDAYGWIRSYDTWQTNDHTPVVAEVREYRFYAMPENARLFDTSITFTANHGDVLFGDTKEGGVIAARVRDEIRHQDKGRMVNAQGGAGEDECWGKPSEWTDYSGPVEGAGVVGIAMFDNPSNFRHPTRWHIRNYGLMTANPFGLSYFTKGEAEELNGDYTLKSGESLPFNYRICIHTGNADEANIAEHYKLYTADLAQWAQ